MYFLRISGTNEYISSINPDDTMCFPPGSATSVVGMGHADVLWFNTPGEAGEAADMVAYLEGFTCTVEHLLPR